MERGGPEVLGWPGLHNKSLSQDDGDDDDDSNSDGNDDNLQGPA